MSNHPCCTTLTFLTRPLAFASFLEYAMRRCMSRICTDHILRDDDYFLIVYEIEKAALGDREFDPQKAGPGEYTVEEVPRPSCTDLQTFFRD